MTELMAGVASRDMTPGPGVPMWGYTDRPGPATGTLDPLYAKTIVFRASGRTVGMVSLDLGRVPAQGVCNRIRERAKAVGVDYVFLAATHTHHAPVMEVEDAPYMPGIEAAIGDSIVAAAAQLEPVQLGIARTTIDIGHNRRKVLDDGRCFMIWRNDARVPTSPVDREAVVVKITAMNGQPLATLVHFACHPVVMGPSNVEYSADYVGEMTRLVKAETGAECLFFQGGCGDINPYEDKTPMDRNAVAAMRAVGRVGAEAVLAAWKDIAPVTTLSPSLAFSETPVRVGVRWNLKDPAQCALLQAVHGDMFGVYMQELDPDLAVPLSVVVLNGDLAFMGMPGEIFVQFQIDLKNHAPVRHALLCGYTNGYHAYFPTVKGAVAGGYGGVSATYVGLGAGNKLVTEAILQLATLTGGDATGHRPEDFIIHDQGPVPD